MEGLCRRGLDGYSIGQMTYIVCIRPGKPMFAGRISSIICAQTSGGASVFYITFLLLLMFGGMFAIYLCGKSLIAAEGGED